MTSLPFFAFLDYSSLAVLAAGGLALLSFIGTGKCIIQRLFGRGVPPYLSLPLSALLGIHVYSLLVQLAGFAHCASPALLKGLLVFQVVAGVCLLIVDMRRSGIGPAGDGFRLAGAAIPLAGVLVFSLLLNLVIALAPSTKSDEVYVYMHLPLNLLLDGGLYYYRFPHFLFLPMMHYHIIAAPFYALGLTDALNVVSWGLSSLFVFFAVSVLWEKTRSAAWSLLVACGLYVGMHSPVWYVTGGSGAFGLLGMSMLIYMVLECRELTARLGGLRLLGIASFLSMSGASSKLSNVPLAILCLAIIAFYVWRESGYRGFFKAFGVSSSFWVVFYLPALVWTWAVSGHFLGPMGDPVNAARVASAALAHRTLDGVVYQLAIVAADLTPFVWGGTLLFLLSPLVRGNMFAYALGAGIFCTQAFLILWKMPLVFRYFGGVHFALALFFWANAAGVLRERFATILSRRGLVRAAVALCLGPWLAMQVVYAAPFFPVVFGAEPAMAFLEARTPFVADFRELDNLLPGNAVLLVHGVSMPIYTPRRVVHELREVEMLNLGGPLFTFGAPPEPDELPGYSRELVYKNEAAVHHAFRTPGRPPITGPLEVWRLTGPDGKKAVE